MGETSTMCHDANVEGSAFPHSYVGPVIVDAFGKELHRFREVHGCVLLVRIIIVPCALESGHRALSINHHIERRRWVMNFSQTGSCLMDLNIRRLSLFLSGSFPISKS